jgi:hypothetical protein
VGRDSVEPVRDRLVRTLAPPLGVRRAKDALNNLLNTLKLPDS